MAAIEFLLIVAAYITPMCVALRRGCEHTAAITIISLFLGWTFVGWVICLAWAASGKVKPAAAPVYPTA